MAERIESLDPRIRSIWSALGRTGERYVLTGGTAIALRLGHRMSFDVDLATSGLCEHPNVLRKRWDIPELGKHKWVRRKPDHYIKFFATAATPKIDVHGRIPGGCLELPSIASNGLRVASLTDLLKQKISAMCFREQARDGFDVAALLEDGRADVASAVAAARDDAAGMGPGRDDAENLGRRLERIEGSPWREFPVLRDLAELLLSDLPPSVPANFRIQGPEAIT